MEREQLQIAISLLETSEENPDPALSAFARCHNMFLTSGDKDGFWWSFQLLQGIICRSPYKLMSRNELFSHLMDIFTTYEIPGGESSVALAAFHVGKTSRTTEGKYLFLKCLELAKTDQLKYEAATGLGIISHNSEESLQWFQKARTFTPTTVALYRVSKAFALMGRDKEAASILGKIRDSGNFSFALASMLKAVILASSRSASLDKIIAAYSTSRTMLLPLMANWEMKLWNYLGCNNSYRMLLIQFLNIGMFVKYMLTEEYIQNLERSQAPVPEELEECLFVIELYEESRTELAALQGDNIPLEKFMDPRPHLEQGIEILFSRDHTAALEPLVFSQQVAIKAGHATCFYLNSVFMEKYIEYHGLSEEETLLFLEGAFQNGGQDQEDAKAWAAYYLGKTSADSNGVFSEPHYRRLKLVFENVKTSFLAFHMSEALGHAATDLNTKVEYFEAMRVHALVLEREEFIVNASFELSEALVHEARLYDRASRVQKELQSKFPDSKFCEGVSAFMEGSLSVALQSLDVQQAMRKAVACFQLLPRYDPAATMWRYFGDKDGDIWCWMKNSKAQNCYRNALGFIQDSFRQVPYRVCEEYDSVYTALGHLGNITRKASLLLKEGALEEAEEEAANALQLIQKQGVTIGPKILAESVSVLLTLAGLVCAYYRRHSTPNASNISALQVMAAFINEAIQVARQIDSSPYLCSLISFQHGLLLLELGEVSAALAELEHLPYQLHMETNVSSFDSSSMGRIKLFDNFKSRFAFMQWLMWESDDLRKALVWAERGRAQDLLFSLKSVEDRENYLKEHLDFDTDYHKAWSEIETTSEMLGKETVMLVTSLVKHTDGSLLDLFIYLVHSGSDIVGVRAEGAWKSLHSVEELLQAINWREETEAKEMLQEYYELLISPFTEELENIQPKRIIFIPNQEYCKIPFVALMDKSKPQQPFLIQSYAIATTHSIRLLKQCLIRGKHLAQKRDTQSSSALLVEASEVPNQSPLLFASEEIELIHDILKEARYRIRKLVNENATKQVVLESLIQCSWVHVASHTVIDNEHPDAALSLSTGPLTWSVIQDLGSAINASAVVLSSCSSGIGRIFAEGVMALSRSFHVVGSPSVVVSLWPVGDEATYYFMEFMYRSLVNGVEISEALQTAIVNMLEERDEGIFDKYGVKDWAAFTLSGSPSVTLY